MQIKTQNPNPPIELTTALATARLNYSTDPQAIYYCIPVYGEGFCGVFGDGDNACYEWFVWNDGDLRHSDSAYGVPEIALRDVLKEVFG